MRSSARFYASLQLAFDLLATCFRHAHASRKPGLQLARIMECGLNRRTDGRTKGRVEYIIPPATPEWRSIKIIIEVVLHSSERLVLRDTQKVFCRAMLCKRGLCRTIGVCVSVRLSVTFDFSTKTNKHIFHFLTMALPHHSSFPHQTSWRYSDCEVANPLTRASNASEADRNRANIWLHRVLCALGAASAIHSSTTDHGELMTLVAGKRRSLLTAGDDE